MPKIFYLLLTQLSYAAFRVLPRSSVRNGSLNNLAFQPPSKDAHGASLTQSVKADEDVMVPLIRRLKTLEDEAIDMNLLDRAVLQPSIIQGWPDLMMRVEHLYYMLGGDERLLSDGASRIKIHTFLEIPETDWNADVDKFLSSDYTSDIGEKDSSIQKPKKSTKKIPKASFLMVSNSTSTTTMTTTGKSTSSTNATATADDSEPSYSEIEDSQNLRDATDLRSIIKDTSKGGSEALDSALEQSGLRANDSLVDEEEAQDSQVLEEVSRNIMTDQGVMQSDIAASPENDEVLVALLAAANANDAKKSGSTKS